MKITFVLPTLNLSGGIRVAAIYAERLQQRGHQVFIVSTPPLKPTLREQFRSIKQGKGWLPTPAPEPSHFDTLDIPQTVIDHNPPIVDADVPDADVIIATWWETAEWVAKLSPQKGAKAYFIQHHEVFDYLPIERVQSTYTSSLRKITISRWLVDLMSELYGDSNVALVPNSVDTEQFNAPLRCKQSVPTVGLLYSNLPWKGCDVSFRAIEIARQQIPNLRVYAFGAVLPSEALPLPQNTEYWHRPAQHTIKDLYTQCDVWLCGSRSEGFGLTVVEAMACRCPVVSTAVGGPIDTIDHGTNGFIVPIDDAEALAQYLIAVLEKPEEEWQQMSQAAHATATSYSWDDATTLFESALEKIYADSQTMSAEKLNL